MTTNQKPGIGAEWPSKSIATVKYGAFEVYVEIGAYEADAVQILLSAIHRALLEQSAKTFPIQPLPTPCLGCGGVQVDPQE